jgi:hypothetical protein
VNDTRGRQRVGRRLAAVPAVDVAGYSYAPGAFRGGRFLESRKTTERGSRPRRELGVHGPRPLIRMTPIDVSFDGDLLPISRPAILFTTIAQPVITCLNAGSRPVAGEAACRGAVKTHSAITLRDNDPTLFNLESTSGVIRP